MLVDNILSARLFLNLSFLCVSFVKIPSALTNDMELERKQKAAERRKQQKKAKQERLKVSKTRQSTVEE